MKKKTENTPKSPPLVLDILPEPVGGVRVIEEGADGSGQARKSLKLLKRGLSGEVRLVVSHKTSHIAFSAELFLFFACPLKLFPLLLLFSLLCNSLFELFSGLSLLLMMLNERGASVLDHHGDLGTFLIKQKWRLCKIKIFGNLGNMTTSFLTNK